MVSYASPLIAGAGDNPMTERLQDSAGTRLYSALMDPARSRRAARTGQRNTTTTN